MIFVAQVLFLILGSLTVVLCVSLWREFLVQQAFRSECLETSTPMVTSVRCEACDDLRAPTSLWCHECTPRPVHLETLEGRYL